MTTNMKGVYYVCATQFRKDETIDFNATQANIDILIKGGADGLILGGRFGQIMGMTAKERLDLLKTAKEVVNGRVPLMSGCLETSAEVACDYAKDMEKLGIDGLMATPLLGYPPQRHEVVHWFRRLANASDLEIMIYNEPAGYGIDMTPDILNELSDEKNIVAVKESTEITRRVTEILRECGTRYTVFCGSDEIILETMLLGCEGWVCALGNAFPQEAQAIVKLALAGRWEAAREITRWMTPVLNLDCRSTFIQCGYLAMQITGMGSEMVRTPLLPLSGEERTKVINVVETAMKTRPSLPADLDKVA